MALPTAQRAEADRVVARSLIRTRWLVQIRDIDRGHADDCDVLTGPYDYARAARLMGSIRTTRGGFGGAGPYLLRIIPRRHGRARRRR